MTGLERVQDPKLTLPPGMRAGAKGHVGLLDPDFDATRKRFGAAVEREPGVDELIDELARLRNAVHHACNW
jgi:hypothetical protein